MRWLHRICHAGPAAAYIPETLAVSSLGGADKTALQQGASAAIRVGNEIWVSSIQNWIARFPLN